MITGRNFWMAFLWEQELTEAVSTLSAVGKQKEIMSSWNIDILLRVPIAVIKCHEQNQLVARKVYFSLHVHITAQGKSLQELKTGTWRQKLMQKSERSAA